MDFPTGETVSFEVLSVGAVDAHGNPVESYATPVSVDGWAFDAGGTVEQFGPGRDAVISSPRLLRGSDDFVPSSRDRCTVRGVVFEVDGDPGVWRSPFTSWIPGISVPLRRVSG